MAKLNLKMLLAIVVLACNDCSHGSNKIKRENKQFYPLSDITSELTDQDIEAGLRSLSSTELRALSEFIDEESQSPENHAYLDAVDKYWNGWKDSKLTKKKRTIDDLYDDLAHENAGLESKRERLGRHSKVETSYDNCGSEPNPMEDYNTRSKREGLCANFQEKQNVEEYVRQLEDSFPRDQGENSNGVENSPRQNGHIRIKRL